MTGSGIPIPALLAAGGSASETALAVTVIVMLLALAAVFFAVLMPEEDRQRISRTLSGMKRYFLSGKTRDVTEFNHEFDGIRELDNRIPPWFSYLFVGTIMFGGVYMVDYHVLESSPLMQQEYQAEVTTAELQRRILLASEGTIDETTLAALTDPEALKRGSEQFQKYCITCHGAQAQGIVGPNLTDNYWLNGGSIRSVYRTVKMGVPAKGMISWQLVFSPKQIQEIASFILSLQGTNPPNAKKAEGVLFAGQDSTTAGL